MTESTEQLKRKLMELSEMIANLASVELTMHNEMIQHSTRVVHLRESIRQMHKITDQLTDMLDQMEKSAKALAKESEEKT